MSRIKKILQENLRGLTKEELSSLPSTYQKIGDIIILDLKRNLLKYQKRIGRIFLKIIPNTRVVCRRYGSIKGEYRKPQIKIIVGEKDTETIHKEHGIFYKLDVAKIMFSKGNLNERKRIIDLVRKNEVIVDMFAGIGYFSLGIAKFASPKRIYSIEKNPEAFHYLCENIKLNGVKNIVKPIHADCREIALKLGRIADRVIMGLLPSCKEYLPSAMKLIKRNGILHYHGIEKEKNSKSLLEDVEEVAKREGFGVNLLRTIKVKSYAPKIYHFVLDCQIL